MALWSKWPRSQGAAWISVAMLACVAGCTPTAPPTPPATTEPATSEWVGGKQSDAQLELTHAALAEETRHVGGAAITPLKVGAIGDVAWSGDAHFAFALESAGVLHKVAVPELVEQRRITLPALCSGLARCSSGFAVALCGRDEIWFLDEDLNVTARVPAVGVRHLGGSPGRPFVFATTASGDALWRVDAQSGQAVKMRVAAGGGVNALAATADGKFLFCRSGNGSVSRYSLADSGELSLGETSPLQGDPGRRIWVSPDSLYIALPSTAGNVLSGQPALPFATYVFKVTNLHDPVATLEAGPDTRVIGFDPAAKVVYIAAKSQSLGVFSGFGVRRGDFDLGEPGERVRLLLVHPAGRKLLALAERLYWVELP